MADLIDRQIAIDAILSEDSKEERPSVEMWWFDLGIERASEILKESPSADSYVPKCKTCNWARPLSLNRFGEADKRYKKDKYCKLHERKTTREGYCQWWLEKFDMKEGEE